MARPRPKALLDALADTGIQTLENVPESRRAAIAASTQRHQGTGQPDREGGILRGNTGPGDHGGRERGLAEQGGGGGGSTLNIKCINCAEEGLAMKARAYMEAPPMSVVLCANRLQDRREMEEALVHELVHVYDVRKGNLRVVMRVKGKEGRVASSRKSPILSNARFLKCPVSKLDETSHTPSLCSLSFSRRP